MKVYYYNYLWKWANRSVYTISWMKFYQTKMNYKNVTIYTYKEKYEKQLGWVRFEPTPASTAAPSPSESGDRTTAPLRLLKNKFHGTVLHLISLNDPSDRVYFWCASALIIYKELSGSTGYLHQYWSWAGILCWSLFKLFKS